LLSVLHLYSNHAWTGPAELAVNLCLALERRDVEVTFAAGKRPERSKKDVASVAAARSLNVLEGLRLCKHTRLLANMRDVRKLRRLLKEGRWDVLHAHLPNDHLIAAAAREGLEPYVPVVRSSYDGGGMRPGSRTRRLAQSGTDALIEASQIALEADVRDVGFPRERVVVIPPAIDLERFDPNRPLRDMRERLGLAQDDFVLGIVARMQPHRRFEVLLEAVRLLKEKVPELRLVIVGRGSRQEEVAKRPVEEMGLGDVVKFSGYVEGDDYVGLLKTFDVKVFLVPGSDGSCRAVREAMAMGKPVIASRRGMLPELVEDGVMGLVVSETPEELASAAELLWKDAELRRGMGEKARSRAVEQFCPDRQAEAVEKIYKRCLST